jgi:DNA-binding transcriptional LysR family regulator
MDQLKAMKIFCRVQELGSYSAVALDLALTRSAVSKSVSQLEKYLNIKLINRSTRKLHFTEAGQEYYLEATRLLDQHQNLEEQMRRDRSEIEGLIRIGVPGPLVHRKLIPQIPQFLALHPKVQINMQITEHVSDLYKDNLDLVIRMGPLNDSNLNVIQLAALGFSIVATPDYLNNSSQLDHPQDLKAHNCLCFRGQGRGTQWKFTQEATKTSIKVNGNISADCGITLRQLALQSVGIVCLPTPLVEDEIANGSLIPLLPGWTLQVFDQTPSIHLLFHPDRTMPRRLRCFIDWLKESENALVLSLINT